MNSKEEKTLQQEMQFRKSGETSVERRNRREDNLEEKIDRVISLLNIAFPQGAEEHGKVHSEWLKAKQAEAAFWTEMKLDIAKKGVFGLLIILLGLVIVGIQFKLGLVTLK